ncbi:glycoside hydrolase superfamily [Xylogone sp. PMI_703]|nr:glycoside hydrolase superfamily [Xylogone sp. PMI_703]
MTNSVTARYIMYLTGQHPEVPSIDLVSPITHVALAFLRPSAFNSVEPPSSWPLFTTVSSVRSKFSPGTAIMVAIGGWGDTEGFSEAAKNETTRKLFARNVAIMVDSLGADGVDIDWEYPGGNGEDYKSVPNSVKAWEIAAYPLLLSEIRAALPPGKIISAAVPGLRRDMLAFGEENMQAIVQIVDFLNIMTYDLMNRRDNVTKHHTGVQLSIDGVQAYLEAGLPSKMANLGFAFYIKWFKTDPKARDECKKNPVGCKTELMEDPETGRDLGKAGAFSWDDEVPSELAASFQKAMKHGKYDNVGGGYYYWDEEEDIWWSWDTEDAILIKFPLVVEKLDLGGVFAWGLGEDGKEFRHLQALSKGVDLWQKSSSRSSAPIASTKAGQRKEDL